MLSEPELLRLMNDLESFRVERTRSVSDSDKFREAFCSFANDMPGSGLPGFLLIGVDDKTGQATGLKVSDALLQQLAGYASDGTILPAPALSATRVVLSSGAGMSRLFGWSHTTCRRFGTRGGSVCGSGRAGIWRTRRRNGS